MNNENRYLPPHKYNTENKQYSYSDCVKNGPPRTLTLSCPNCSANLVSDNNFICLPPKTPPKMISTEPSKYIPNIPRSQPFNDRYKKTRYLKYHKMQELYDVSGFVVNVHDPTNFDIDFKFEDNKTAYKYCHVISNKYTYGDLTDNFKLSASCDSDADASYDIEKLMDNNAEGLKIGIAYRCRLRGIGIQQNQLPSHKWRSNQLKLEIINLIDRADGWITCNLSDIDVYKRLLVDITINTCNGPIDLCEYLLNRMKGEENPIFFPYRPVNNNNNNSPP